MCPRHRGLLFIPHSATVREIEESDGLSLDITAVLSVADQGVVATTTQMMAEDGPMHNYYDWPRCTQPRSTQLRKRVHSGER